MKKIILLNLTIFMSFIGIKIVNADCTLAKEEGKNILAVLNPSTIKSDDTYVNVYLPTENVYVTVQRNDEDIATTYYNKDTEDGNRIQLKAPSIYTNYKYDIKVYYTDSACGEEPIKSMTIETGIFNVYSDSKICNTNTNYNLDVCRRHYMPEDIKKYVDEKEISEDNISSIIDEEIKASITVKDKVTNVIKEYYLYVLIPVLLISIFYIARIIVVKRKKRLKDDEV